MNAVVLSSDSAYSSIRKLHYSIHTASVRVSGESVMLIVTIHLALTVVQGRVALKASFVDSARCAHIVCVRACVRARACVRGVEMVVGAHAYLWIGRQCCGTRST
eukprot:15119-Amphidinium_carterae.2